MPSFLGVFVKSVAALNYENSGNCRIGMIQLEPVSLIVTKQFVTEITESGFLI